MVAAWVTSDGELLHEKIIEPYATGQQGEFEGGMWTAERLEAGACDDSRRGLCADVHIQSNRLSLRSSNASILTRSACSRSTTQPCTPSWYVVVRVSCGVHHNECAG